MPGPQSRQLPIFAMLLVLCALIAWCWPGDEAAPPSLPDAPTTGEQLAATVTAVAGDTAVERSMLAAAPPEPEPSAPVDLEHAFAFELDLRLQDAFGLPVANALVFAAPINCGFSLWPEPANALGMTRLRWRGKEHSMRVHIAVMAWGILQPMRLLSLEAGKPQRLAMAIVGKLQSDDVIDRLQRRSSEDLQWDTWRVRAGRMKERDELDVLCGRSQFLFQEFHCNNCHDKSRTADYATLSRCGDMRSGLHPQATFCDLNAAAVGDDEIGKRQRLLARSGEENGQVRNAQRGNCNIYGTVRDSAGERVAGVPIVWLDKSGAVRRRTMSNTSGHYQLDAVDTGTLDVRAGGGDQGEALGTVLTISGLAVEWHPVLTVNSTVRGRAVDETGGVLAGWRVEFERLERDWADVAEVRADGSFVFTAAPGMGQCLLWPEGKQLGLPVVFDQLALPEGPPVVMALDVHRPTRARLRLRPVLPANARWAQVETRVTQLETGRTTRMRPSGRDEVFEVDGLAPGAYLIEVGAPVLGWADARTVDVDGRGLWDLGPVALPPPGRVRIVTTGEQKSPLRQEHAFCRRTPQLDVQEAYRSGDDGTLLLAAGEHILLWRDQHGLHSVAFSLVSGGLTEIQIPPR